MAPGVLCVEKRTHGKGEFRFLKKDLKIKYSAGNVSIMLSRKQTKTTEPACAYGTAGDGKGGFYAVF